jgi:hypothetical protein
MNDHLCAALITYRLAHMIANEDGPAAVFRRMRESATTRYTQKHQWVAHGLSCQLCSSFWLSFLVTSIFPSLRPNLMGNSVTVAGMVLVIDRMIYVRK